MSTVEVVQTYTQSLAHSYELVVQLRNSSLSRLVWFVAIDGYALLNAKPFWEGVLMRPASSREIVWLSIPWLLSAVCGVVAHFLSDELAVKDGAYHYEKLLALEIQRIKLAEGSCDTQELMNILNNTDQKFSSDHGTVQKYARCVRFWERSTLIALVIGFIWTVVGPLIFR